GLDAAGASASGIFALDPTSGHLTSAGALATPLHDAAAALLGSQAVVLGGGSPVTTAAVERFTPGSSARVVSQLPQPRSDAQAVVLGGRAYLVGGYDGTSATADVLATRDGQRFTTVARLPVPVRYPAVAVIGNTIYAFGGERVGGGDTNVIQAVDPAKGTATVAGHLPVTLAHSVAVTLGARTYLAGGRAGGAASAQVWLYDPARRTAIAAGRLPSPVANAAAATIGGTAYIIGGLNGAGNATPAVSVLRLERKRPAVSSTTATRAATARPPAFTGRLLIADRGNNRLLLVNADKQVLWTYPSPSHPAPPGGFYFPDDAFFARGGSEIISNEEDNNAIVQIAFPSGRLLWSYGHAKVAGSAPGYLNQPDDAYLLSNGQVTVADAKNCRVLIISPSGRPVSQIGTTGDCAHDPPRALGYPNGDTPLANGDLLISEIDGSWVSEYTRSGQLRWSVHLPLAYPSDPQQLGPDRYLVADYARPGGLYEFDRAGHILWSYDPQQGPGMLDHPSLAERLPNGLICVNDDYRDRVVIINPATKRIVWQYGRTDHRGLGPDRLHIPDGFDLLTAGGQTPTHPATG
ncbi:MAG: hypothetical protein ACRDMJ_12110, partial [Solirubrobacteraceae bacterium]